MPMNNTILTNDTTVMKAMQAANMNPSTINQLEIRYLGTVLVVFGIEEIIRGLFISKKSRWNIVVLGALALIFGSMIVGTSYLSGITTLSVLSVMLSIGLVFAGIPHIVNGLRNKDNPRWLRGFSICVGVLAIASSYVPYFLHLQTMHHFVHHTVYETDRMSFLTGIV